jgi:hypothetical protein
MSVVMPALPPRAMPDDLALVCVLGLSVCLEPSGMKTLFRAERNEDIPSAHPQARRDQPAPGSYRELPDDFGRRCAAQACGNEVACAGRPRPNAGTAARTLRRGQDSNSVGPDQRTPRPAGGRRCSSQESETFTYFDKLFQIEFGAVFSYLGGLVISIKPTKILFFPQS